MATITQELISAVKENESIQNIYFDADGGYHWNCHDGFKININGVKVPTGKKVSTHEQLEIVETLTREEVLSGTSKKNKINKEEIAL